MTMPIIIRRPKVVVQPLDEDGSPTSDAPVDVSCDFSSIEFGVDQPSTTVSTFCGKFQVPDDIEESVTGEFTINADTDGNWSPLVGATVEMQVWDRDDATSYRTVNVYIGINPSLYGTTEPGSARQPSVDFPVLSAMAWASGSYTAPSSP
jgi:hypothetical protein